jgi:flagellar motor switch protein FliN/FliY
LGDLLGSEKVGGTTGPDLTLGAAQPAGPGGGQRVQAVQFGTFGGGGSSDAPSQGNLDLLLDVPLDITAELGRTTRRVRDVLAMGPGSIVELDKMAGEPVDLLVNGKPIAKGEVVVIDENFAVRIIEIMARDERLAGGL